jgi:hypothetical protein
MVEPISRSLQTLTRKANGIAGHVIHGYYRATLARGLDKTLSGPSTLMGKCECQHVAQRHWPLEKFEGFYTLEL